MDARLNRTRHLATSQVAADAPLRLAGRAPFVRYAADVEANSADRPSASGPLPALAGRRGAPSFDAGLEVVKKRSGGGQRGIGSDCLLTQLGVTAAPNQTVQV